MSRRGIRADVLEVSCWPFPSYVCRNMDGMRKNICLFGPFVLLEILISGSLAAEVVTPHCYHCSYHRYLDLEGGDSDCISPRRGHVPTAPCPSGVCVKKIFDQTNYYNVARYCSAGCKEMEINMEKHRGKQYCCHGNQCNGADGIKIGYHTYDIFSTIVILTSLTKCAAIDII